MCVVTKLCLRLRRRRPRAYATLFAATALPVIVAGGAVCLVFTVAWRTAADSWWMFRLRLRDEWRFLKWIVAHAAGVVRRSWRRGRVYGIINDNESKGGKEE